MKDIHEIKMRNLWSIYYYMYTRRFRVVMRPSWECCDEHVIVHHHLSSMRERDHLPSPEPAGRRRATGPARVPDRCQRAQSCASQRKADKRWRLWSKWPGTCVPQGVGTSFSIPSALLSPPTFVHRACFYYSFSLFIQGRGGEGEI